MSRFVIIAFVIALGVVADARQKAAVAKDVSLSKKMEKDLNKIAGRFMDKSEIQALVDLSSPKDRLMDEIDSLQKEIIAECNLESQSFANWIEQKQSELQDDQTSLGNQQERLAELQTEIASLQGQIGGLNNDVSELQEKLSEAENSQATFEQQLQDATDLRAKTKQHNDEIIAQHKSALVDLDGLRQLVEDLNVESNELVVKKFQALVKKFSVLHKRKSSSVARLVDSVKRTLNEIKNKDPQDKAQIKAKLLQMIGTIIDGVQASLDLYTQEEQNLQNKFDNEIVPGIEALIQGAKDDIVSFQQQIGDTQTQLSKLQSDLADAEDSEGQVQAQIDNFNQVITSLQNQIADAQTSHSNKQGQCKVDLDNLEEIRQYVADHVQGMTPGNNCHPGSPDCARCLYDAHCDGGQVCSDEGKCAPKPQPEQKLDYFQLIPDQVGTQMGRRVDVGVVPQSSFNANSFAYVFKFQQLETANGWNNLFNVVNVGDNFPFPDQAALYLVNDLFEIDVCQDGLPWSQSYWYRFFTRSRQSQIGKWNTIAFVANANDQTVSFYLKEADGTVASQVYTGFHGNPTKYAATGIWVNGRGYTPLPANFQDFRRYDRALSPQQVADIFSQM